MAGTADPVSCRLLRALWRRRHAAVGAPPGGVASARVLLPSSVSYGHHAALGLALGHVCLGGGVGGGLTLDAAGDRGRAACLLISLWPCYSADPADHRAYPQLLRHLWVPAVVAERAGG